MANLQIRIDDTIRDRAQEVAANMGLDLTSAVRMFLYQMVRVNGLPFQPKADPFYSSSNMAHVTAPLNELRGFLLHSEFGTRVSQGTSPAPQA